MPLPVPELGLVIRYGYLWRHERGRGAEEARKIRPCVIVDITSLPAGGAGPIVSVVPITHRPPADPSVGIPIPPRVRGHLGLDQAESWIIANEVNIFQWPGFDVLPEPGRPLPSRLFDDLVRRIVAIWKAGGQAPIGRDSGS